MRMDYKIIEVHIYYDFSTFISNEIRKNMFNIEKFDFCYSSYLWCLIVHQNLEALVEARLQFKSMTLTIVPMPIDLRVSLLTKVHGQYYEFMEKFFSLIMQILMGKVTHRLHRSIMQELQGGNINNDWYFLNNHTIIIRYAIFKAHFSYQNLLLLNYILQKQVGKCVQLKQSMHQGVILNPSSKCMPLLLILH